MHAIIITIIVSRYSTVLTKFQKASYNTHDIPIKVFSGKGLNTFVKSHVVLIKLASRVSDITLSFDISCSENVMKKLSPPFMAVKRTKRTRKEKEKMETRTFSFPFK